MRNRPRWWLWFVAALAVHALLLGGLLAYRQAGRAAMTENDILATGKYAAGYRDTLLAQQAALQAEVAALRATDGTLAAKRAALQRATELAPRLEGLERDLAADAAARSAILARWQAYDPAAGAVMLLPGMLLLTAVLLGWGAAAAAADGVLRRVRWGAGLGAAWAGALALVTVTCLCLMQSLYPWPELRFMRAVPFVVMALLLALNAAAGWRLARSGHPRWLYLATALLLAVAGTWYARPEIDAAALAIWANLPLGFALIAWPTRA